MQDFSYLLPTEIIFGKDVEKTVGEQVKKHGGTSVLLVHYGDAFIKSTGLADQIGKSLTDAGLKYVELDGILPNPRADRVYAGIELARANQVDFIVAIGGGSTIDTAKAVGLGSCYDGDVADLYYGRAVPKASIPLGCVATIPAAGSETSTGSVITFGENKICLLYTSRCV